MGDFNVDIFATDADTERRVIIENQLEETDHDHLGKLITYPSGKAADVVIWLVRKARPEHRAAIEWLNNHTDEGVGFILCEIKLFRIGNSEPALKFEIIEQPNDWVKEMKKPSSGIERTKLPKIKDMLERGVVPVAREAIEQILDIGFQHFEVWMEEKAVPAAKQKAKKVENDISVFFSAMKSAIKGEQPKAL